MGESMSQDPLRKEVIDAIKEGAASPTPEFAASEAAAAIVKEEDADRSKTSPKDLEEHRIAIDAANKQIESMSADELDSFIEHINRILPQIEEKVEIDWKEINSLSDTLGGPFLKSELFNSLDQNVRIGSNTKEILYELLHKALDRSLNLSSSKNEEKNPSS